MIIPLITICIPSFRRSDELGELLDSIAIQYNPDIHEILIIDDCSPNFSVIQEVVINKNLKNIKFFKNPSNFGYDKNLRELIKKASGQFVLFMGNDDLLEDGALNYYTEIVKKYGDDLGFLVRSYKEFDNSSGKITKTIKYSEQDELVLPSQKSAGFLYRRSVAIMGMMYNRKNALELDCDKFDGSIYYQLWLSGNIALTHKVLISARPTALRRCGLTPDFGAAEVERDSIGEGFYTQNAFIKFIEKMFNIAKEISLKHNADDFYKYVVNDFSRYSLPFMAPLRPQGAIRFVGYCIRLRRLGLNKTLYFYMYFMALLVFGARNVERIVSHVRKFLGTSSLIASNYK